MKQVTQWFGPDEKPVHVGVYESTPLYVVNGDKRARWDGEVWRFVSDGSLCFYQRRRWRGLADKPEQEGE